MLYSCSKISLAATLRYLSGREGLLICRPFNFKLTPVIHKARTLPQSTRNQIASGLRADCEGEADTSLLFSPRRSRMKLEQRMALLSLQMVTSHGFLSKAQWHKWHWNLERQRKKKENPLAQLQYQDDLRMACWTCMSRSVPRCHSFWA